MFNDTLLSLAKQLYPRGRSFKLPKGGFMEALHIAINVTLAQAYQDFASPLNSLLPDNANFTAADATDWERRLGMINHSNDGTLLSDRMAAILRKLQSLSTLGDPNAIKDAPGRQNWRYLQEQLQLAEFNVYVYENIFPDGHGGYTSVSPLTVSPGAHILTDVGHGDWQHGQVQHGGIYNDILANHIEEKLDLGFDPIDFRSSFFVGGSPLGTFANVPAERHDEFRQLILQIKPVQTIAFLFINYI